MKKFILGFVVAMLSLAQALEIAPGSEVIITNPSNRAILGYGFVAAGQLELRVSEDLGRFVLLIISPEGVVTALPGQMLEDGSLEVVTPEAQRVNLADVLSQAAVTLAVIPVADGDFGYTNRPAPGQPLTGARPEGNPGFGSGNNPGQGQGGNPGFGPGNNPGQGGENPGQGQGGNPGFGPGNNPGQGGGNPGYGPGNNPGQGQGSNPGQGQGANPGYGPGNNPGQGSGANPGHGSGNNPGYGPGNNPGQGGGNRNPSGRP